MNERRILEWTRRFGRYQTRRPAAPRLRVILGDCVNVNAPLQLELLQLSHQRRA